MLAILLSSAICDAVESGKYEKVTIAVEKHKETINSSCDKKRNTPLHIAVLKGYWKIAKYLVLNGADVNAQNFEGATPLHYAVLKGNLKMVKFLVEHGAYVDGSKTYGPPRKIPLGRLGFSVEMCMPFIAERDFFTPKFIGGLTPLHLAIYEGKRDIAEYLIAKGADVSRVGKLVTPLEIAIIKGDTLLIKLLLSRGAEVRNWAILHAAESNDIKILKTLLNHFEGRVNALSLITSVRSSNLEIVKLLVEEGRAYLNTKDHGCSPLHMAIEERKYPVVLYLLSKGARVDIRDFRGATPMHYAAYIGDVKMMKSLIREAGRGYPWMVRLFMKYKPWVNTIDDLGRAPLHWAIASGNYEAVKYLLSEGADPNLQDILGRSPLHWAYYYNHHDIVRLLISKGANENLRDAEDNLPCTFSKDKNLRKNYWKR